MTIQSMAAKRLGTSRAQLGRIGGSMAAMLLAGCAHQANPAAAPLTNDAASNEAMLRAAADRVMLDRTAFDAALQRGPSARPVSRIAPAASTEAAQPASTPARASVYFHAGSTRLATEQVNAIERLARSANHGARWQVTVRTAEAAGTAKANQRLAQARAGHVVEQIVRFGVARDAIKVISAPPNSAPRSAAKPVHAASSVSGRLAQADRVDIDVLGS